MRTRSAPMTLLPTVEVSQVCHTPSAVVTRKMQQHQPDDLQQHGQIRRSGWREEAMVECLLGEQRREHRQASADEDERRR